MMVSLTGLPDKLRGGAWPSSVRTVKRAVKSVNERDPHPMLPSLSTDKEHSLETAADKAEEGVGDGRSVCPESSGLHAALNGRDNGFRPRKRKAIPKNRSQSGSRVVTHPREAGIPSKRRSLSFAECVPVPCTHRPSSHPSGALVSFAFRGKSNLSSMRGAKL